MSAVVAELAARNPFLNLDDEKETSVRHKMKGKLCKLKVCPCSLLSTGANNAPFLSPRKFEFSRGRRWEAGNVPDHGNRLVNVQGARRLYKLAKNDIKNPPVVQSPVKKKLGMA